MLPNSATAAAAGGGIALAELPASQPPPLRDVRLLQPDVESDPAARRIGRNRRWLFQFWRSNEAQSAQKGASPSKRAKGRAAGQQQRARNVDVNTASTGVGPDTNQRANTNPIGTVGNAQQPNNNAEQLRQLADSLRDLGPRLVDPCLFSKKLVQ